MKTKTTILSLFAMLFSIVAFSQDSTRTTHKNTHVQSTHVQVSTNSGASATHTVKHRTHYRTRRHTTRRTPAARRTTTTTTTTTNTNK